MPNILMPGEPAFMTAARNAARKVERARRREPDLFPGGEATRIGERLVARGGLALLDETRRAWEAKRHRGDEIALRGAAIALEFEFARIARAAGLFGPPKPYREPTLEHDAFCTVRAGAGERFEVPYGEPVERDGIRATFGADGIVIENRSDFVASVTFCWGAGGGGGGMVHKVDPGCRLRRRVPSHAPWERFGAGDERLGPDAQDD